MLSNFQGQKYYVASERDELAKRLRAMAKAAGVTLIGDEEPVEPSGGTRDFQHYLGGDGNWLTWEPAVSDWGKSCECGAKFDRHFPTLHLQYCPLYKAGL